MNDNLPAVSTPPAVTTVFGDAANFELGQRVAKLLASSDLVPKQYRGNIQNVTIALELAARTRCSPLAVMQSVFIINGRPSWSAQFIIAVLNSCGRFSPLRFALIGEGDGRECRAVATDLATGEEIEGPAATVKMAKSEGWFSKDGSKWQTMPELMIRYRAATFFGRLYAPDILMGMSTADELADIGRRQAAADVDGLLEVGR